MLLSASTRLRSCAWDTGSTSRLRRCPCARSRRLAEAVVLARSGTTRTRATVAVVDAMHAASMIALAAVRRDDVVQALASAALTTGLLASLRWSRVQAVAGRPARQPARRHPDLIKHSG